MVEEVGTDCYKLIDLLAWLVACEVVVGKIAAPCVDDGSKWTCSDLVVERVEEV